jgi:16S rRNA (adenine1518-N6/adenine1519-N6)-dimethyltransferase
MTIRPRKRLGQHFLRDPNTARRIAAAVPTVPEAVVVEIGAGTGALTEALIDRFPRLVALEVDERVIEVLKGRFPALDVRQVDVLRVDWEELSNGRPLVVVGNLPYFITTPILFSLFAASDHVHTLTAMMQREVADRLVAAHGTKTYGVLSVAAQLTTRPRILFRVSRNVFYPRPDVESAVVQFEFPLAAPAFTARYTDVVREVTRAAFGQRRKQLRNSLRNVSERYGRVLPPQWERARAEELTPEEFVALADYLTTSEPDTGGGPG